MEPYSSHIFQLKQTLSLGTNTPRNSTTGRSLFQVGDFNHSSYHSRQRLAYSTTRCISLPLREVRRESRSPLLHHHQVQQSYHSP